MIIDKAGRFALENDMFPAGGRVLCAVSGGADSMCLLALLGEMEGIEPVCAHFNHRLRGEESDRDEAFVRNFCVQQGIEFHCGGADVASYAEEKAMGIEEAARVLRYDFLNRLADETGCEKIATAHNAGDNAETVLLNLCRGSGLRGLCGIPPVRGRIVRPLLSCSRDEIEAYLDARGIPFVTDSSNLGDDYARNRIRHQVLPLLRRENPSAVENIAAATVSLREDEEYLHSLAEKFLEEKLDGCRLPVEALTELPRPLMMRVLRIMCGSGLGRGHAQAIYMLCLNRAVHGHCDVPGMRITKERGVLSFGTKPAEPIPKTELNPGDSLCLEEAGIRIFCEKIEKCGEIHKSFNTFFFKRENICGKIFVASRSDGDRIRLQGRGCTKSLKKLFLEAGLSLDERIKTPVFYDEEGLIAVGGFGVAQRCAASAGDNVVKIEVRKIEEV